MAEARGDVRDDEISFRCCEFQPRRGDFRPESKEWSDSAGRFAERDEDLNLWFADIHVSLCQGENIVLPDALGRSALYHFQVSSSQVGASRRWFLLRRTGHPFAVSGLAGRHRRLSLCSLPVLKQF